MRINLIDCLSNESDAVFLKSPIQEAVEADRKALLRESRGDTGLVAWASLYL